MTNVFAVLVSARADAEQPQQRKLTKMRQHAPEDGESRGGLLVELPEGRARQLLQVLGELERRRGSGSHDGGGSGPSGVEEWLSHDREARGPGVPTGSGAEVGMIVVLAKVA